MASSSEVYSAPIHFDKQVTLGKKQDPKPLEETGYRFGETPEIVGWAAFAGRTKVSAHLRSYV